VRCPHAPADTDGTHPRPQLLREEWTDLCGTWQLAYDDAGTGMEGGWAALSDLGEPCRLRPRRHRALPPGVEASGIGDGGPTPCSGTRRGLRLADVAGADAVRECGHRIVLRFGAVDYSAQVWLDGRLLGSHEGGQTPFSFDVTALLTAGEAEEHVLVVRVEDDPARRDPATGASRTGGQAAQHLVLPDQRHLAAGVVRVVPAVAVEHLAWTPTSPPPRCTWASPSARPPPDRSRWRCGWNWTGSCESEHRVRWPSSGLHTTVSVPALVNGQARQDMTWSRRRPGSSTPSCG
jgi:hypothetical protein